jgi:hypothetical protein
MSTKSRTAIWGGQIMAAEVHAKHAREEARKAAREADRAEARAWSVRMEGYGAPAQPSPTIGQCIHGALRWLEVECNRCKTRASLPLDAKDIGSPDHHVPDVHPDPKVDTSIRRQLIVCVRPRGLCLDSALYGIYRTCKFRQQAVTSCVGDPATVCRNQRIQDFPPLGQIPKRTDLISAHQAAITFDVGRENRHKPALDISHLGLPPRLR